MNPHGSVTPPQLHRAARLALTAVALGLFAAAMWFAWLGWDHEYHQVAGVAQGPYQAWQVVGCGASIAVAAVLAQLRVRTTAAVLVLGAAATVGFTIPWSVQAGSTDESGLWMVGLLFLLVGAGGGLTVLLVVTRAVAFGVESRRGSR